MALLNGNEGGGGSSGGNWLQGVTNSLNNIINSGHTVLQNAATQNASEDSGFDLSLLDTGGGGGSSGGGGSGSSLPSWYYQDQSDLDWASLNETKAQNAFNQQFADTQFKWQQAQDDRDYALSIGNFELAKQKQADANYWQGKTMEAEERMNTASNSSAERRASIAAGAEVQSAQISAQAQIQGAEIRAAADRYASNQQLQANLANAVNDADRNAAMAAWNREQAQIAKMEDDTKRIIAENDAKINLFGAETDRMGVAGQLAQNQNDFILKNATSPKNLFGMYFMQRGVSPDWDTMAAGGTPGTGSAIVPQNALTAYVPQSGLPQLNFGAGSAYGGVGGATGGYSPQANPFIGMGINGANAGGGGGGSQQSGANTQATMWNASPNVNQVPPVTNPQTIDIPQTPAPAPNFSYTMPGIAADRFAVGTDMLSARPAYSGGVGAFNTKQAMSSSPNIRPVQAGGYVGTSLGPRGTFGQSNVRPTPTKPIGGGLLNAPPPTSSVDMPLSGNQRPPQGFTTSPKLMTGDSPQGNPFAGGARPEIIENPTGAPLRVQNSQQTAQSLNYPKQPGMVNASPQLGGQIDPNQMMSHDNMWRGPVPPQYQAGVSSDNMWREPGVMPPPNMPYGNDNRMYQVPPQPVDPRSRYDMPRGNPWWGQAPNQQAIQNYIMKMKQMQSWNPNQMNQWGGAQRFALGSDPQQAYNDAGLGNLWLGSSDNAHLNGVDLPNRLNMLKDQGVPLSPSLVAGATGQVAPTLNLGSAFTQRGGGSLPSLQGLNRMTTGERENFQGYSEGVVGVPWRDTIDYLSGATAGLKTAQRSRGAY